MPSFAPVILPEIVPTVHTKLLGVEAVNAILVFVPLHIVAELLVVTTGTGSTVTVRVKDGPIHEPATEVGVITYATLPAAELLGFIST